MSQLPWQSSNVISFWRLAVQKSGGTTREEPASAASEPLRAEQTSPQAAANFRPAIGRELVQLATQHAAARRSKAKAEAGQPTTAAKIGEETAAPVETDAAPSEAAGIASQQRQEGTKSEARRELEKAASRKRKLDAVGGEEAVPQQSPAAEAAASGAEHEAPKAEQPESSTQDTAASSRSAPASSAQPDTSTLRSNSAFDTAQKGSKQPEAASDSDIPGDVTGRIEPQPGASASQGASLTGSQGKEKPVLLWAGCNASVQHAGGQQEQQPEAPPTAVSRDWSFHAEASPTLVQTAGESQAPPMEPLSQVCRLCTLI